MADLRTRYLGLELRNPVVVSSSNLTASLDNILRAEEMGAGAVVLKSIFEEQFLLESGLDEPGGVIFPEARDYLQSRALLAYAPREIFQLIERAKKMVSIPIIASINCQTAELWPDFSRQFAEAGADALELNIYHLPLDLATSSQDVEKQMVDIVGACDQATTIPLAVKLPYPITALPHLAHQLTKAGADGLVLFNWFLETDVDLARRRVRYFRGHGQFSQVLRWVGLLAGRVQADLAASGGVMTPEAVIKLIMVGAKAVQVCRLLYDRGLAALRSLVEGVDRWLNGHGYSSLRELGGELSWKELSLSYPEPKAAAGYFRVQYMKAYGRAESARRDDVSDEENN